MNKDKNQEASTSQSSSQPNQDQSEHQAEMHQPAKDDLQAMQQLEVELGEAKKAQEELLAQTQRTLADYSNLKKRFEREREELGKFAAEMTLIQPACIKALR